MGAYRVEVAREDDLETLIQFFREVYSPGHITANPVFLRWQYQNVPGNKLAPHFSGLILWSGKRIIGFAGLIPYQFNVYGQSVRAAFLANLIVRPEFRSKGAGALLVEESGHYFDLLYSIGINKLAMPVLAFCKWSQEEKLKRWVYDCGKEASPASHAGFSAVSDFNGDWDRSWEILRERYPLTVERSSAYLRWRFTDNPLVSYKIFGARADRTGVAGYIALRIEKGSDFKGCRIVDFIADRGAEDELVKAAIQFARSCHADFIDFFCSSPQYESALEKNHFYLYDPLNELVPPVFILPVDYRRPQEINFTYKFVSQPRSFPLESWFITKSDGDKDRASSAFKT